MALPQSCLWLSATALAAPQASKPRRRTILLKSSKCASSTKTFPSVSCRAHNGRRIDGQARQPLLSCRAGETPALRASRLNVALEVVILAAELVVLRFDEVADGDDADHLAVFDDGQVADAPFGEHAHGVAHFVAG